MIDRIQWLGHGSFRIQGPPLIYVNPWRVARSPFHADAILVTNDQYDHCSPADIEKLRGRDTVVVSNPAAAAVLGPDVVVLRPWQSLNIGAARVTAVPAYTFNDSHPVSQGGLGFVISLDYYDVYYAGSTDLVPELSNLRCDVAILPIAAGQGTLNVGRAVELAGMLGARWVIPSHWGTLGGTHLEVKELARALNGGAELAVLEKMR